MHIDPFFTLLYGLKPGGYEYAALKRILAEFRTIVCYTVIQEAILYGSQQSELHYLQKAERQDIPGIWVTLSKQKTVII